jgi:predicted ATPase/DNA-binding winged helix-turn-helix (wHTH) protein
MSFAVGEMSSTQVAFGDFRIDPTNVRLTRGGQTVGLTQKAFDALLHLAQRPDELVTKEQLLKAVWPDVIVSDASVKVCIGEIRKALDDDPHNPRFIETVHRRGYRFIAKPLLDAPASRTVISTESKSTFVGRGEELDWLMQRYQKAATGSRETIFVTGRAGSGKTALIEAFVDQLRPSTEVAIGRCFEQFGASEPYLPVWEALQHVGAEPAETKVQVSAGSSVRLLRGIVETVERAARERTLLLVLEDLQWADYSTLDVISALAHRRGLCRLMLLCTYRHDEVLDRTSPLRVITRELLDRELAEARPLMPLSEGAVREFLAQRAPTAPSPNLASALHLRTAGHPLFLVQIIEELIEKGLLGERAALADAIEQIRTIVPASVVEMIDAQIESLDVTERQLLERAVVAGMEFSAAALVDDVDESGVGIVLAERACEELSRRHRFLESRGLIEWPDGTVCGGYRFIHDLYHHVVQARIPAARRAHLHRAVGIRLENAWMERAGEKAAELAGHFERGRDWPRAVRHLRRAADSALKQYAHREAVDYLRRAVAAIDRLPAAERGEHELPVLMSLAVNLGVTAGFGSPEVLTLHERAYALSRALGGARDAPLLFPVLWGIWVFHKVRSDLSLAQGLADELLALADQANDDGLRLQALQALAVTSLCRGKPRETVAAMERAEKIYDPKLHGENVRAFGQDPGVACLAFGAVALALLGEEARALRTSLRAEALARELQQPSSIALALHFAAMMHQCRDDAVSAEAKATEAFEVATAEGYSFWRAGSTIIRGWARVAQGDESSIDEIRRGLDAWLAGGSRTYHAYYLGLLADALLRLNRAEEARCVVDHAFEAIAKTGEHLSGPRLQELEAKLTQCD